VKPRRVTILSTVLLAGQVLAVWVTLWMTTSCKRPCRSTAETWLPSPSRVLFIGNSFTYINGGIDQQLHGMAPSCQTACIGVGGAALQQHWDGGNALQMIRTGKWDYVVLQEQSQTPVFAPAKFRESVRSFAEAIRSSGAQTVLLMTWERPDSVPHGVTTTNLAAVFKSTGSELGAKVAPAGLAFARSLQERPDLALYRHDGHPTPAGTYLAACVLYATIFEHTPVENRFSSLNLTAETRAHLQRIAAEMAGHTRRP
jgi:hypothetical protein